MANPNQQIIAFYNLENLFDTVDDPEKADEDFLPGGFKNWDEYRYLDKLEKITKSIASISSKDLPAIIGVSEIENKTVLVDLLYQPAFKDKYDFVHYDSPDRRGIDVALLYNKEKFKPISHQKIQVLIDGNDDYVTRDILYVKGEIDNEIVHFFVNHWPSRREGTLRSMPRRIAAANCLYTKAHSLLRSDSSAKIVIMGDFNDLPVSKSIASILNAKSNKNISTYQFYNLASIPYRKKMGSLFAKNQWLMFDQIIISKGMMTGKGLKINSPRLTVHLDKKLLYYDKKRSMYRPNKTYSGKKYHGGYSDHLPVYVNIDLEKN